MATQLDDPQSPRSGDERILQAAEELFSEHGFDAVSMNAIAERAGVSKANVFHHFATKQDLYIAVLQNACRSAAALFEQLEAGPGPLEQRLRDFCRAHLKDILGRERTTRLILRDLLENGPQRGRDLAEQVFGRMFARFVEMLRSAQARGELRADLDPAAVAVLLLGANVFFFQARDVFRHYPDVGFADDPVRYTDMLADILLHGVLPKSNAHPTR